MSPFSARITNDRLRFRLGFRLRFRLRGRLRFPAPCECLSGFPCIEAGFARGRAADISTSASQCSQSRPLPIDPCWVRVLPLCAVGPVRRETPLGRGTSAVGCALHLLVTERGAVLYANRVVAARRRLTAAARLARPATPSRPRRTLFGKGCAVPSLSRRLTARCWSGPARRRPRGAR
jgi:hypothetical protein